MSRFKFPLFLFFCLLVLVASSSHIKAISKGPDLAITDIGLNPEGKLVVELVNLGPDPIPPKYTSKNPLILYVYRNGKAWGGITLKNIDPKNELNNVGTRVNYVFSNLKITESELVQVILDPHNLIGEIDKQNNSFQKKLSVTLPDLTISDIYLNGLDRLTIEITNNGSGALPKKYWEQSPISLYVYRDGKPWGRISLKICDPSQKLHLPKSKVHFISNIRVDRPEQIQILIDPQNMVRESNETNNSFQKKLNPASPDLSISNLWVVNDNWVAVQIVNDGSKKIDSKFWDQKLVYLDIFRRGKSWGRFSLETIDPHQGLKNPGGKVTYVLNGIRIFDPEEIRAVIDSQNIIPEADESNNSLQKILVPQNQ